MVTSDLILQLNDKAGAVGRIRRSGSSVTVEPPAGSAFTVEETEAVTLIRAYAADLIGDAELAEARSSALAAKPLVDLLVEALDDGQIPEEQLEINGELMLEVHDDDEGLSGWWPDQPGDSTGVDVALLAHWDLLHGEPSFGTGNPGTLSVHRYGDLVHIQDHATEITQLRRSNDLLIALSDAAELIAFHTVTQIDSPWLADAGDETIAALLEAGSTSMSARCLFVNDQLWRRSGQQWTPGPLRTDLPDPAFVALDDGIALHLLSVGRWDTSFVGRWATPRADSATEVHPDTTGTRPEQQEASWHLLMLPGAQPSAELVALTLEAALKSTATTFPVHVGRLHLQDGTVRFGVSADADQAAHICDMLALPGWLTLLGDASGQELRWTSREGTTSSVTVQTRPGGRPVTPFEGVELDAGSLGM